MDRFASMSVFVRVAEAKSFAAAAATLKLSPTMVANHVRSLEAHLGARLIERTTRRHTLTDIGAAYLERCKDVLASLEAAEGVAEAARTCPEGVLRITAPVSYGAHRLAPLISDYCRAFPQVRVDLGLNDRVVDLEEEGFHVGIRSGRILGERLVTVPLRHSVMRAAASPAYLHEYGTPLHPDDLASHNRLAFAAWGANHAWRFTRDDKTIAVPVRGGFTANNGQALLHAALGGMGVIVQADVLLDAPIASGALVRLLPDWELPTRPIHLIYARRTQPSAKLRSFVAFVAANIG